MMYLLCTHGPLASHHLEQEEEIDSMKTMIVEEGWYLHIITFTEHHSIQVTVLPIEYSH